MEGFNILDNLKIQSYLNNQSLDNDDIKYLDTLKFNEMYTSDEFASIQSNVRQYRTLDEENRKNPSPELSKRLQSLNEDILYQTGIDASKIQLSELNTTEKLENIMMNTNLRSKNDLYVAIDYDDFSNNSNFVKCKVVGHDYYGAYGIAANAKMVVTSSGMIITTKNSLYMK